jgi:hypothetical protein
MFPLSDRKRVTRMVKEEGKDGSALYPLLVGHFKSGAEKKDDRSSSTSKAIKERDEVRAVAKGEVTGSSTDL